jgi:hypothetical protein
MAKGSFALGSAASEEIVAADEHRAELTIQLRGSAVIELAFGETAVAGEGIKLIKPGDSVQVKGHLSRLAVYGIGTQTTSNGGWQDGDVQISPVYST